MKKIYQTIVDKDKGNCMQTAIASLFNLKIKDVPDFWECESFWGGVIEFILSRGCKWKGTLYNENLEYYEGQGKVTGKHTLANLKKYKGIDGYFTASVFSPKYYDKSKPKGEQTTHAVIIDKEFNIVNPVNKGYKGLKDFPLHEEIGYHGIIHVSLIERGEEVIKTERSLDIIKPLHIKDKNQ